VLESTLYSLQDISKKTRGRIPLGVRSL